MTRRAAIKHNKEWLEVQVNVPRQRCGLLMIAMNDEELKTVADYEIKSTANGEDVRIIGKQELMKLEPNLSITDQAVGAFYSPEEFVVDPFLLRNYLCILLIKWLAKELASPLQ